MTAAEPRLPFDEVDLSVPQTHALLIGVGDYDHLLGGRAPAEKTYNLKQLPSPPESVSALARLVLRKRADFMPALGSLAVLCTGQRFTGDDGTMHAVPAPTMAAIRAEIKRWLTRCNARRDNFAIFYFCGHGVEVDSLALLAQDFLANPENVDEHAVDFQHLYRSMSADAVKRQLFLIDCCRNAPGQLENLHVSGTRVRTWNGDVPRNASRALFLAAGEGEGAAAPPGRSISYFTQAVIDGLDGLAAGRQAGRRWLVTSTFLIDAIKFGLESAGRPPWSPGAEVGSIEIVQCDRSVVRTSVTCDPDDALRAARLEVLLNAAPHRAQGPPHFGPWSLPLDGGGMYEFSASFPKGEFNPTSEPGCILLPPSHTCVLKV